MSEFQSHIDLLLEHSHRLIETYGDDAIEMWPGFPFQEFSALDTETSPHVMVE